ncbi:16S rRNA (uracil(1498)-N(3))-methyltransferase [Candidatus Nitrospira bockiana]
MPVFFLDSPRVQGGTLTITGPLLDHLRKSLRVQIGETLLIGDPLHRRRYRVRVCSVGGHGLEVDILEERSAPPRLQPAVILAQAILKGDKMDWVIQKATELGVAAVAPLVTERVIARPRSERLEAQLARWQRIALEAAQQSERWEIPVVHAPRDVADWVRTVPAFPKLMLAERVAAPPLGSVPLPDDPEATIALCLGPEGGWTDAERTTAIESGVRPVTLGPRILRGETAAISALAVVQHRIGALSERSDP